MHVNITKLFFLPKNINDKNKKKTTTTIHSHITGHTSFVNLWKKKINAIKHTQ